MNQLLQVILTYCLCALQDDEFCKPKAVDFFLGIERSREQTKKVEGQNQGFSSFQQLEEIVEGTGLPRPFVYENVSALQAVQQ